jgi:hypothetical protein
MFTTLINPSFFSINVCVRREVAVLLIEWDLRQQNDDK